MAVARHEVVLSRVCEEGGQEAYCLESLSLAASATAGVAAADASSYSSLVLLLGLPYAMPELAFLSFVEPYLPEFVQHEVLLAAPAYRPQGQLVEQQSSGRNLRKHALITFKTPRAAQSFVDVYNNLHFPDFPSSSPALVLLVNLASSAQGGLLPTCSVCVRRVVSDRTRIPGSDVFPVNSGYAGNRECCDTCFYYGAHLLEEQRRDGEQGSFDFAAAVGGATEELPRARCNLDECNLCENIWLCLVCSHAGCGRYTKQHAEMHFRQSRHPFALELVTGRIWDYAHDTFVHLQGQEFEGDDNSAIFPEDAAATSQQQQQSPSHALFARPRRVNRRVHAPHGLDRDVHRKITSVQSEYEQLLESQLEAQRLFFEKLLAQETVRALELALCGAAAVRPGGSVLRSPSGGPGQAEAETEAEQVLAAIEQRKLDISALEAQHSDLLAELREVEGQSRKLRKANETLIREQKSLKDREAELQQRAAQVNKKAEERTADLKQQVADISFYLSTRKQIQADRPEVAGGSLIVQASSSSTPSSGKKGKKS